MTFDDWLSIGREHGFCSPAVCSTHDGLPMSEEEILKWDDGDDPCIHAIRLYADEWMMREVEKNVPEWRK